MHPSSIAVSREHRRAKTDRRSRRTVESEIAAMTAQSPRHRHRRAVRSALGGGTPIVVGNIAPFAGCRIKKHRDQPAGLWIDKTLRCGHSVAIGRLSAKSW